ncbi:putative reverse transcriptase domain-containing protein [Tanacetum coccineum]
MELHISIIPYPERRKIQEVSLYLAILIMCALIMPFVDLRASFSVMPLSTYLNLGLGELAHTKLTMELADRTVKYLKGIAENVLVGIGKFVFPIDFIILDMPEDIKVPLILGRPFLSIAYAKIDVFKRKITLRVGDDKIIFKSVKPANSLIKRVYMLSLREIMELDLEARLMGETLVIKRPLDLLIGDYIELNDLNEPLKLWRNHVNDLMPTVEEGEVIDAPMDDLVESKNDKLDTGIDDYPSDCDYDKKIHIDCAHNLKFLCMIEFEFVHVNFFPISYVNLMFKKFYNSIIKDKLEYKGNNIVGALINVPIFVETFSVITDFAVLEDMDAYHDEGMGDVIVGEPFLREVGIKARRFEGTITLYKGDEILAIGRIHVHDTAYLADWLVLETFYRLLYGVFQFMDTTYWFPVQFVIMEYLVKISKKTRILEHKRRYFEEYCSDTQYAVSIKKIRRICTCTHQRPRRKQDQYAVSREDQYAVLEI